jgi:TRAP-type uncharacterized transport system substrate-binding protein
MSAQQRLRRWARDGGLAAIGLLAIIALSLYVLRPRREPPIVLTLTAGSREGTREVLAEAMVEEARARGITLRLVETHGSEDALDRLDAGDCDLALVQGGLRPRGRDNVRQVATLHVEPLHLLVRPDLAPKVSAGLRSLAGRRVNLGELGSGTYCLAAAVLAFAGLESEQYRAESRTYTELLAEEDTAALPDAIFTVSTLPSRVARHLAARHDYRLVGLPFAEAFALSTLDAAPALAEGTPAAEVRREYAYDAVIPAFTYGVEPGVPPEATHTLGTRLLIVANKRVSSEAVGRLLDVVFDSRFSQVVYPPLLPRLLDLPAELDVHAGTTAYLHRRQPLITGDFVDMAEKWFSIAGVSAGGAVCLWQWLRRRGRSKRDKGFETYVLKVAEIERRVTEQELSSRLDLSTLVDLRRELLRLNQEALDRYAAGELEGESLMAGFLSHVSDTRNYLTRLILHERDNLEAVARLQGSTPEMLWDAAVDAAGSPPSHPAG